MLLCLTPLKYKHKITGTIDEESSKTKAKPIFEESRVYNEKEFQVNHNFIQYHKIIHKYFKMAPEICKSIYYRMIKILGFSLLQHL